jgi:hypothetical protein
MLKAYLQAGCVGVTVSVTCVPVILPSREPSNVCPASVTLKIDSGVGAVRRDRMAALHATPVGNCTST